MAVIRITTDKLYFIILDEDKGPRKPLVWCDLPNSYYFVQYNMLGVSEEHNEIFLEFSPGNTSNLIKKIVKYSMLIILVMLAKSLISLKYHVSSLKIKLTNKQTPCLTLEIDTVIHKY